MTKQKRSRKWKLALWGASLATIAVAGGIVATLTGAQAAGTLVIQGFGMFATILALYSAANVSQKHVEGKAKAGDQ
jgi:hypothetical protein